MKTQEDAPEVDLEDELDALLKETVQGLRQRISGDDANASDYTAAAKLLGATGRLEDLRDSKTQERANRSFYANHEANLRETPGLEDFDETGRVLRFDDANEK